MVSVNYLVIFILEFQTARDRVFRRVRNNLSGLMTANLDRRVNAALNRLSNAEIALFDESASRLSLANDRIVHLPPEP